MIKLTKEQVIPISLTIITFLILVAFLFYTIKIANSLGVKETVIPRIALFDILVGFTIYLKTSIDFGLFIANLMRTNGGWKKRISIELGTALGNGLGTIAVLIVWIFLKDFPLLLAAMIFISSLILIKMAEEGFKRFNKHSFFFRSPLKKYASFALSILKPINNSLSPLLRLVTPSKEITNTSKMNILKLFVFSITIPFVLGLDDFAGYIPLFTVINVFSFSIGVFLGHMFLNIFLFISPQRTVKTVESKLVIFFGSTAFVAIALFGFYEVFLMILGMLHF